MNSNYLKHKKQKQPTFNPAKKWKNSLTVYERTEKQTKSPTVQFIMEKLRDLWPLVINYLPIEDIFFLFEWEPKIKQIIDHCVPHRNKESLFKVMTINREHCLVNNYYDMFPYDRIEEMDEFYLRQPRLMEECLLPYYLGKILYINESGLGNVSHIPLPFASQYLRRATVFIKGKGDYHQISTNSYMTPTLIYGIHPYRVDIGNNRANDMEIICVDYRILRDQSTWLLTYEKDMNGAQFNNRFNIFNPPLDEYDRYPVKKYTTSLVSHIITDLGNRSPNITGTVKIWAHKNPYSTTQLRQFVYNEYKK